MKKFNPKNQNKIRLINRIMSLFFHTKHYENCEGIYLNKVNKILIIDFALIGDTIMLIPFLRVLKKNSSNSTIDLVCNKCGKDILEDQELINNFFLLQIKKNSNLKQIYANLLQIMRFLLMIRKTNYDIIIEPRGDLRFILFMYFCKGKRKISLTYTGGEYMLTDAIIPNNNIQHLIDDKLYILEKLGCIIEKNDRIPYLSKSEIAKDFIKKYKKELHIDNKFIIGIHPSASIKIKEWDKYDQLLEKINDQNFDFFLIIFKKPGEDINVDKITQKAINLNIPFKVSETNLSDYKIILSLCDLVICNDSGAGHISASYNVTTIVIMGPFMPEFCAPLGKHVFPISKQLTCKPCLSKVCKFGNGNIKCLKYISVEDVMSVVYNALNYIYYTKTNI